MITALMYALIGVMVFQAVLVASAVRSMLRGGGVSA